MLFPGKTAKACPIFWKEYYVPDSFYQTGAKRIFILGFEWKCGYRQRIEKFLEDISKHPYSGIGKPEALKYDLTRKWSRRINTEHRIIYSVREETMEIYVFSMRYHYNK